MIPPSVTQNLEDAFAAFIKNPAANLINLCEWIEIYMRHSEK